MLYRSDFFWYYYYCSFWFHSSLYHSSKIILFDIDLLDSWIVWEISTLYIEMNRFRYIIYISRIVKNIIKVYALEYHVLLSIVIYQLYIFLYKSIGLLQMTTLINEPKHLETRMMTRQLSYLTYRTLHLIINFRRIILEYIVVILQTCSHSFSF